MILLDKSNRSLNRVGERRIMNCGLEVEIVKYINNQNMDILVINTGEIIKHRSYCDFKKGKIRPSNIETICGWGIVDCKAVDETGECFKSFNVWRTMLQRTKNSEYKSTHKCYECVDCCEEWKYYSNFKKWYEDNYYETKFGDKMCLDKDILIKNNKLYSPKTCIIVPERINLLFIYKSKNGLPCGVGYDKSRKKYRAQMNNKFLGRFDTPEEAFYSYKEAKEKEIKKVADEYKDDIPQKLYEAMYNYKVEITD